MVIIKTAFTLIGLLLLILSPIYLFDLRIGDLMYWIVVAPPCFILGWNVSNIYEYFQ